MNFRKDSDILASYGFDFKVKKEKFLYKGVTKSRPPNREALNMWVDFGLELRQYKKDSIQLKNIQIWNCRAFSIAT